ncbi:FtsK/SpoIIIE domain-containing protein [Arsenicicoccus piscis]|uniref:FtsK/SpoIIIE domain-containing protein n=1 Tax=Arsenicicoccus piscis TaxID=673954 RepID=UPI0024E1362F|nr:FtsK/SpoIIIE domain-containing protein [Arsenicicoccus piscis]
MQWPDLGRRALAEPPPDPGFALLLGLGDHLHELAQRAAWWSPDTHGHLAVVGAGRSGRTTLLRTLALSCSAGRAAGRPGAAVSVHVIDGDDALLDLRALPHVGTIAAGHDTELVARLLRRLLTRARAGAGPGGGSGSGSGTQDDPTILLVDGWSQVIRRAPMRVQSELSDLLTNLLASGPATGVHVAATFDRGFLSSGIGSHFRERLVLALADPTDALLLGLDRPRSTRTVPGRATRVRDRCDLQVALTAPIEPPTGPTGSPTSSTAAFRLAGLPDRVALGRLWSVDEASTDDNRPPWPVGIGEDDTQVGLDLRQRRAALVVGPPGSGRSSALALLAAAQHRPVVLLSGTEALATCWRALAAPAPRWAGRPSEPGVVARLDQLVAEDPDLVVVVDDLDQPSGSGGGWGAATGAAEVGADAEALLLGWLATNNAISPKGANNPQGTQSTVLAAATTAATASAYRGLLAELRRHRTGLVLAPSGVLDHEVFGVPVPTVGSARPGRGVVVESSRVTPVQLAHPDGRSPD